MRGLCGLALSFIKICLSTNGWLSKRGATCALSTLSQYATPLRLHCKTCRSNLQLKEKIPSQFHRRHRTQLYPSRSRHEMQCLYGARLERSHPRGAIHIGFRLTNWLVSNYEYSNEDGHMTNSIEPADDVLIVATVLWFILYTGAAHWSSCQQLLQIHDPKNSIHLEYELM